MTAEWRVIDPDVPVRQGDILVGRDPSSGEVAETLVVITADCDISKGKFGRQLVALRLLPISRYYREIWAAKKRTRFVKTESDQLLQQLVKWHSIQIGNQSTLTDAAARRWVKEASPDHICNVLEVPAEHRPKFSKNLQKYKLAFAALESTTCDPLAALASAKAALSDKSPQECEDALQEQAKKEELPDDAFLLTSVPHYEANLEAHFVLLRDLVGIPFESIVYRASDATNSEQFLRTGRLEATFKYAISQAFGAMYSRIGLPSEYELRRDSAVSGMKLRR